MPNGFAAAFADPAVWDALNKADSLERYVHHWLILLCATVSGTVRGMVVLRPGADAPYAPVAFWPDVGDNSAALMQAAEAALQANQGIYRQSSGDLGQLAHPVRDAHGVCGVVALEIHAGEPSPLAMRLLQWGLGGLQLYLARREVKPTPGADNPLQPVLEAVALVLENQGFERACTALVTHLADTLACRRVALGFVEARRHRLKALSHSITFSDKTQLSRALEAVMDEAGELGRCLVFPPAKSDDSRLYPAHEQLAGSHGNHAICSVPVSDGENLRGALVLERPAEAGFDENTRRLCEAAGTLTGLILVLQRDSEQTALQKAGAELKSGVEKTVGPGHLGWKFTSLAITGLLLWLVFAEGPLRIAADARLEPVVQQAVVAPMDGFIAGGDLRAGAVVEAGSRLFQLESKDLELEQTKLQNQWQQYQDQYRKALAGGQRAEITVLKAQMEQTAAQLSLVGRQLERTAGYAPFAGRIVSGDLSQKMGAAVKRGEVLFEVAPLTDYRVVLDVHERDIAEIRENQSGRLVLSSAAHEVLPLRVRKITPVSESREGRNYFRVEADLEQAPALLRPGMQGVGKITVGQRRLIWVWSRELVNWARIWLWSWWP